MKTTKYLYGCDAKDFMHLPYAEALRYKIDKAKELLDSLLEINFMERDTHRVNDILKAIKFNEKLLEELTINHK